MLTSGEKRELLVIQFAQALLTTSGTQAQDGIIYLKEGKETTKQIKVLIAPLLLRLQATFRSSIDAENNKWFKSKLNSKIWPLLTDLMLRDVELVSFAISCLYVNFSDNRIQPLSDRFAEYKDAGQYFEILDLIELDDHYPTKEMFLLASDSVTRLKGGR